MRFLPKTVLALLSNAVLISAQTSLELASSSLAMKDSFSLVNDAISNFIAGVDPQPVCVDPVSNHVVCVTIEDDIDDTTFAVHPIVPDTLTLGEMAGTSDYDLGKGLIQGFMDAVMADGCSVVGKYGLATYPWLDPTDNSAIMATSVVKSFSKGPVVTTYNTFQSPTITGGAEMIYAMAASSLSDGIEFPQYPPNIPPLEGGFYDVDVTTSTITFTLRDNRSSSAMVYPADTFDTYYFIMPSTVSSIKVVSSANYNVIASIMADGTPTAFVDLFGTGIVPPDTFDSNVIQMRFGEGTDMTVLGQQIVLSYTTADDMTMTNYVCGSDPIKTEPLVTDDTPVDLPVAPKRNLNGDLIPEFIWYEATEGVDYDYYGSLEMCGGKAIKMDYPTYVTREFGSNAVFAYRQFGMSENACGDDMAPLMRLKPGTTYKINFINSSESDTNLHTHGLHIGGNGYSDDVIRAIPAGMCGVYIWDIIENHASGMHWYHPHLHEWTFEQVRGRAFGPIFVDEHPDVLASYPPSVQAWLANEIFVQMSTETEPSPILEGDGVKDGRCVGGYDVCYPRANNKRLEHIKLIKDEWYSLELHNINPAGTGKDIIKFFGPDGTGDADCITMITGYDGVYRSKVPRPVDDYPEEPNYFHCNGASRLHLAIKCQSQATLKLSKEESSRAFYGIHDPEVPVILELDIIEGEKTIASPYADEANLVQWEPPRPQYLEDLTTWDGPVETWDIRTAVLGLDLVGNPPDLSKTVPVFNNKVFHGATPNHYATYGAVQEWSYYGSAAAPGGHPMHVHINHMQVFGPAGTNNTDCGPNFEYGEWVDTIRIVDGDQDPCVARHRFNDYTGKVILHCHDLFHEDAGMMGLVMIEGGPEDPWGSAWGNDYEAPAIECINVM